MNSSRRSARSIEAHLSLGLPVLFSELLVFKWTPNSGFPAVTDEFRVTFDRMQEVENLGNELRVFFTSYDGALDAFENSEVRRNTFRFLDQYGTIDDLLKNELLRTPNSGRGLVPEYLEERIRNQEKWFKGEDSFSLEFAREFLRRKFSTVRNSFRAPQPISLLPPVPPPRRHRSGSSVQQPNAREPSSEGPVYDPSQPSTSQAVSGYTASGRPRRNSAPVAARSPPKPPRQMTTEQLPSPPPTPPPLRHLQRQRAVARNGDHRSNICSNSRTRTGAVAEGVPVSDATTSPARSEGLTDAPALPLGEPSAATTAPTTNPSVVDLNAAGSEAIDEIAVSIDQGGDHVRPPAAAASPDGPTGSRVRASGDSDSVNDRLVASQVVEQVVQEVVHDLGQTVVIEDRNDVTPARPSGDSRNEDTSMSDKLNNNHCEQKKLAMVTDKLSKDERLIEDDRPLQETAM